MIWAVRTVSVDQVRSIEGLFRAQTDLFDPLGKMVLLGTPPQGLMMRLAVSLPRHDLLAAYVGFEQCKIGDIPVDATLLGGTVNRFRAALRARKRAERNGSTEPAAKVDESALAPAQMFRRRLGSDRPFKGLTDQTLRHKLKSAAVAEPTKAILRAELELRSKLIVAESVDRRSI